jgi:hypothetical protein
MGHDVVPREAVCSPVAKQETTGAQADVAAMTALGFSQRELFHTCASRLTLCGECARVDSNHRPTA